MQTYTYTYKNKPLLEKSLLADKIPQQAESSSSVLVQVFSGNIDSNFCISLAQEIKHLLPNATIIGSTSIGEINAGEVSSLSVQISISLFQNTTLKSCYLDLSGITESAVNVMNQQLQCFRDESYKALLINATPLTIDCDVLTDLCAEFFSESVLMGGGAGDNGEMKTAFVFNEHRVSDEASLIVFFSSEVLSVISHAHLHWQPIGKVMTVTSAAGKRLFSLDDEPAFDVYARYLNVEYDPEHFFSESLEFPLLLHKKGNLIARVPISCHSDGSLMFISDIEVGDKVQIGFGDVNLISSTHKHLVEKFSHYPLESIFVYSCGCRRLFLKEDTVLETKDLNNIAPTCGYFTAGEFYRDSKISDVLNLTLTAYGLTEQPINHLSENAVSLRIDNFSPEQVYAKSTSQDSSSYQHLRILEKLTNFLNATTQELEYSVEKTKQAADVKTQFLANISHELRTPLASILGYAGLIARGDMDRLESINAAEIIIKNGQHVTSLIDDILEFSKVNSGQIKLLESEVNLPIFVHSLQQMILPLIEGKPITFDLDIQFPLPHKIKTDALRLRQIMINLLNNAAKFTDQGTIILQLSYDFHDQKLIMSVEDTGKGIKPENLNQMFQAFEQLDVQSSRQHGGAGLGLSISQELALLLGGDIQVDSQEGVGSCFTCIINAAMTSAEIIDDVTYWSQSMLQSRPILAQQKQYAMKVLLAEDHEQNRILFERMLNDLGCKVVAVENGEQALAAYQQSDFELILLDIQMPVMDGITALKALQRLGNEVPVIAVTANVLRSDIETYFKAGFVGHLAKPISTLELTSLIDKYALVSSDTDIKTLHYADLDEQYRKSLPSVQRVMSHFFEQHIFDALADEAHKLRGSAVHFNHPILEDIAVQVEVGIKQQDSELIADALKEFARYLKD